MNDFRADENVVLIGDLNARLGDVKKDDIIRKFGVLGANNCGERLIEMCSELCLLTRNKCFKKRMKHQYTWERVTHGGVADREVMDYVMSSKDLRGMLIDVNVLRGALGGNK